MFNKTESTGSSTCNEVHYERDPRNPMLMRPVRGQNDSHCPNENPSSHAILSDGITSAESQEPDACDVEDGWEPFDVEDGWEPFNAADDEDALYKEAESEEAQVAEADSISDRGEDDQCEAACSNECASADTNQHICSLVFPHPVPFAYEKIPFPVDALPSALADIVYGVAESRQVAVDMCGCCALGMLSVCLQGKIRIQIKQGYEEPVNLYINVVAAPSERKSGVLHDFIKPLNVFMQTYNAEHAVEIKLSQSQCRILDQKQKDLESKVAIGKATVEDLKEVAQALSDFSKMHELWLYVDDVTPEQLLRIMEMNDDRGAIISSEGGIFDILAGTYTKHVNLDVLLKAYDEEPIISERVGRAPIKVLKPKLTIMLMAQPKVLSAIMSNDNFRGRGLISRFLFSYPESMVGDRVFNSAPVDVAVRERYEALVKGLLSEPYPEKEKIITLSDDAFKLIENFANEIEPKLRTDYSHFADWTGKLIGHTARIAALLCRANALQDQNLCPDGGLQVDGTTMENAIRLGKYFLSQAEAIFSDSDPTQKNAEEILDWIRKNNFYEIEQRTVLRTFKRFKNIGELMPVLELLEKHNYIMKISEKNSVGGRSPKRYAVNPAVHDAG